MPVLDVTLRHLFVSFLKHFPRAKKNFHVQAIGDLKNFAHLVKYVSLGITTKAVKPCGDQGTRVWIIKIPDSLPDRCAVVCRNPSQKGPLHSSVRTISSLKG